MPSPLHRPGISAIFIRMSSLNFVATSLRTDPASATALILGGLLLLRLARR
jgi:hypothetical protein